ncbi:unnamed protein product [Parnassius apollo]|uniref:(apollo) hypothetical protein n=1 Tax=Parnassius apollo TaxID=110799 RepID=A0A8S3W5I4_PARAO|nr:unnamed protein product [Parnassius apollo]
MPKDLERLKQWIEACKRTDLENLMKIKDSDYFYNNYVVCSDHFDVECFRNKDLYSQGLMPGSVPTLKLYNKKNTMKRICPREINLDCPISSKQIKLNSADPIMETQEQHENIIPNVANLQREILCVKISNQRVRSNFLT